MKLLGNITAQLASSFLMFRYDEIISCQFFDTVRIKFNGNDFYQASDSQYDVRTSSYLRHRLKQEIEKAICCMSGCGSSLNETNNISYDPFNATRKYRLK